MPTPGLPIARLLALIPLILLATSSGARSPNLARYPLHVHVLTSDNSHKTPRMSPGDSLACDSIEGVTASTSPFPGGGLSLSGMGGDPCSLHPEMVTGRLLDLGDDAPVFSGDGKADLVSPPSLAQGLTFHYDDCSRIRMRPGFQSLPARWKRPGQKLEVLVPSDDIPANGRPLPPVRCTFTVAVKDFIYLLMPTGAILQVSPDDYWKHPALRIFLSGRTLAIQQRPRDFTVSAHPTQPTH